MGLDMYLTGEAFYEHGHPNRSVEPFPIEKTHYSLGYWRKHPNLHGYLVERFANGVDECQRIGLVAKDMKQIIQAVKDRQLPDTTGCFFGESDDTPAEIADDIKIFEDALAWLETKERDVWRSVSYRASW